MTFSRDISERHTAEKRLRDLAEHDPHTGLVNRTTFLLALEAAADGVADGGSVLLLDLDGFKHVNDSLGHRAGDVCLRHVAEVLRERVREGDLVARLGGDEFAVLLPRADVQAARGVAEALLELLRTRPVTVDGRPVRMSASVGVAAVTGGARPEELLHLADAAMYQAKQAGRDRVAVYSEVSGAARTATHDAGQAQRLRQALAEGGFALVAQPIRSLHTDAVHCFELLVRLQEPGGALVAPSAFLPAAERFDLVQGIDRWVVGEAVRLLQSAEAEGAAVPRLHVNLSGRSLSDPTLIGDISDLLADVDPSCLVFEITETAAVTHLDTAIAFTQRLSELGCGLALDDFGAGYASFYYLKHLPVETVKIDGDFVRGVLTDRLDRAVVRATVSLAADLGYTTVAEHVETAEVLEELRRYGVDHVQGYHVGRPVVVAEGLHLVP